MEKEKILIAAGKGTPFYWYDMDLLRRTVEEIMMLSRRYSVKVHYAIKANNEPRILRCISSAGIGADCVSGNEVAHAVENGFHPSDIVFAGVAKTDSEIRHALSLDGVLLNCESIAELLVVDEIAGSMGVKARLALRVNPNVDAHTHRYVTTGLEEGKFGILPQDFGRAIEALRSARNIDFQGLHVHIGSQITEPGRIFALECAKAAEICSFFENAGFPSREVDLGGGLGIDYYDPDTNPIPDFRTWISTIDSAFPRREGQVLRIEPGRAVVGQCGTLVTGVVFIKKGIHKEFIMTDTGMNDLVRVALYGAYHKIENLSAGPERGRRHRYDIVGPICESADVWATGRLLRQTFRGDVLAVRSAGAYGAVMSSRYNMRDPARAEFSDDY